MTRGPGGTLGQKIDAIMAEIAPHLRPTTDAGHPYNRVYELVLPVLRERDELRAKLAQANAVVEASRSVVEEWTSGNGYDKRLMGTALRLLVQQLVVHDKMLRDMGGR